MPHLSLMRWSFKDELAAVATQVVGAGTPETTWYVYDGDGKRVRKVTDAGGAGAGRRHATVRALLRSTAPRSSASTTSAARSRAERRTLHVHGRPATGSP